MHVRISILLDASELDSTVKVVSGEKVVILHATAGQATLEAKNGDTITLERAPAAAADEPAAEPAVEPKTE